MKWHLNIGLARVAFITYHYNIVWCSVSQDGFFLWCCTDCFPSASPGDLPYSQLVLRACHLLVCAEGEMTFEHPANVSALSSHALLSDVITVILAACPERMFTWLHPLFG